ncbi:hypothetical protein EJ04DRAFT_406432, partial [Polyplosphaeria fusca]
TSSEPPIFSSDGPADAADVANYTLGRPKRKFQGSWWEGTEAEDIRPDTKKSRFTRNFDSGVWMMSDDSTPEADLNAANGNLEHSVSAIDTGDESVNVPTYHVTDNSVQPREALKYLIDLKIETGLKAFHLDYMGLRDTDLGHLSKLAQIIKEPLEAPGPSAPGPEYYRSMLPELEIDLTRNELRHLAPELFLLNIKYLRLRHNKIEELPPQIGSFKHLRCLDVALNDLKTLPYDLLQLTQQSIQDKAFKLIITFNPLLDAFVDEWYRRFASLVNHFINLVDSLEYSPENFSILDYTESLFNEGVEGMMIGCVANYCEGQQRRPHHTSELLFFPCTHTVSKRIGCTPVTYYDRAGRAIAGSVLLPTDPLDLQIIVRTRFGNFGQPDYWFRPDTKPEPRSLFNVAMHQYLKTFTAENLEEDLADVDLPREIELNIARAKQNQTRAFSAFRSCHMCGKSYVVARAEWIEFWAIRGISKFVPFKALACSWACVPEDVASKP